MQAPAEDSDFTALNGPSDTMRRVRLPVATEALVQPTTALTLTYDEAPTLDARPVRSKAASPLD